MGLFSRNKEAADVLRGDDVPFEALKRSPRGARKARGNIDPPPPLDPADAAKSRARHRLIGAVALALAAIVFVPMLFDRTPVATTDDISLQIPDRDSPFEGRRGVPDPTRGPLKASSELPVVPPSQNPAPVASAPSVPVEAAVPDRPVASRDTKSVEPADAPRPADKPSVAKTVAEKPVEKPADRPTSATPADDPKALAALAGKSATSGAATESTGSRTFAVQIAAYSAADKARAMRDQLVANGMRAYVESVSTTQGLRTRVRLGPFASREAADAARQKLKTMKLDGSVVPL